MKSSTYIGTGKSSVIKVASQMKENGNWRCVGVFVSKLDSKTNVKSVSNHVRNETNLHVEIEKRTPRYDTYSTFVIKCDARATRILLDPQNWPKGTFLKRFYSKAT